MTSARRDYYEVLGIDRNADARTVKNAFHELALRYHPDRNKDPDAEERFKEIAEAYAVLSDPQKRRAYDAGGHAGLGDMSAEDLFRGTDFGDLFGLGHFGFGESIFDRFFGRPHRGPARGEHLETVLEVSLDRIATGGTEKVTVERPQRCETCTGSGAEPGTTAAACTACEGTGQQVTTRTDHNVTLQQITACTACSGRGTVIEKPCRHCDGRGIATACETLEVNVPPGIGEGMMLRIRAHGLPSPDPAGEPGDLLVLVRAEPDPRFERRGADLWRTETITVAEAALGTHREIPTLDGPISVRVPPGAQPGEVLRIAGKGLPEGGHAAARGDLLVALEVRIPTELTEREKELYEELRTLARDARS